MTEEATIDVDLDAVAPEGEHGRCPTAFRYWQARELPEWRKRRELFRKVTGKDLFPTDEQAQMLCEDLFAGDPVAGLGEVPAELVEQLRALGLLAGRDARAGLARPGPDSMRMISLRIFSASASKSRRIRAATPSFSRTRPRRMCSVPM